MLCYLFLHKVIVYSKQGCHLCERAIAKLNELSKMDSFEVQTFEITRNEAIFEKYSISIPVVELDGRIVFRVEDIDSPDDIEIKLNVIFSDLGKA
jgi:glutaredoxin